MNPSIASICVTGFASEAKGQAKIHQTESHRDFLRPTLPHKSMIPRKILEFGLISNQGLVILYNLISNEGLESDTALSYHFPGELAVYPIKQY